MKKICFLIMTVVMLCGCHQKYGDNSVEDVKTEATEELPDTGNRSLVLMWEEKEVSIPAVCRDYEFWFLTDSHITLYEEDESNEIIEYAEQRKSVFNNQSGTLSHEVFTDFIDAANKEKPDMVLFGGDIIDFPSKGNMDFLEKELERLEIPYIFTVGNHDWTFPWEYMTPKGVENYRPLLDEHICGNMENSDSFKTISQKGNSYGFMAELEDLVILSVDNSSNQVAAEGYAIVEEACSLNKPVILLQHVPFSTESLIAKAKEEWGSPVTLGMQVHGGIAPNDSSTKLWYATHDEDSVIKLVLGGHVHFSYEEKLSDTTLQIISDAAFKGNAVKIQISGE